MRSRQVPSWTRPEICHWTWLHVRSSSPNRRLVALEQGRVIDRPVMMQLAPSVAYGAKNAGRSKGEFEPHVATDQRSALPSNRDEAIGETMKRIVVERDLDPGLA